MKNPMQQRMEQVRRQQEQIRQQQERIRQQQEHLRQQQMQADWMQQQKNKAKVQKEQTAPPLNRIPKERAKEDRVQDRPPATAFGGSPRQDQVAFLSETSPKQHPFIAILGFLVGVALTIIAGVFIGNLARQAPLLILCAVWIGGFIICVRWARRKWRGIR